MQALIIDLPANFQLGDVADVRIGGERRHVVWIDRHPLLFLPAEIVHIHHDFISGSLHTFICKDARE
jgi:hypothetical protein